MLQELKKMTYEFMTREKLFKDIDDVYEMERELLPRGVEMTGIDYDITNKPADKICGDVFDVIPLKNGNYFLYIADVTGHGIPAGFVSGMMNFLIFTLSKVYVSKKKILTLANKVLKQKTKNNVFITITLCEWNPKTQWFSYVQAGHEPILFYKNKTNKMIVGQSGGIALGMIDDVHSFLEEKRIRLCTHDQVLLYTDGIIEAWKDEKEYFGFTRLQKSFANGVKVTNAKKMNEIIVSDVESFSSLTEQKDDMTLISIMKQ